MKLNYYYITLFFIIFTIKIIPQFNLYSNYQGIYDDNIFNNNDKVIDFISSFSFGTSYNYQTERNNVHLFYEGGLGLYQKNTDKSFNSHKIGIVETYLFSKDYNPLNAGVNYSFRNNQEVYELLNYNQISAYINYRHSIDETNFLLGGWVFNLNSFVNFTLFSNYESKFFMEGLANLESGTSFSLRVEAVLRNYLEVYDFAGYQNKGYLLKGTYNIGQSLAEKTGMNVYLSYQRDLSSGSRYILSDSIIYYEEEIFNDVYSFSGYEIGAGLKHYFIDDLNINLQAKYLIRDYSNLPAVNEAGLEQPYSRFDKQFAVGLEVEYDISKFIKGLSLTLNTNYFNNLSNDNYYKYRNNIFSASINYYFE